MVSTEWLSFSTHSCLVVEGKCLVDFVCDVLSVWKSLEVNPGLIRWDRWINIFGLVIIPIIHSPKESFVFVLRCPPLCSARLLIKQTVYLLVYLNVLLYNFPLRPVRGAARDKVSHRANVQIHTIDSFFCHAMYLICMLQRWWHSHCFFWMLFFYLINCLTFYEFLYCIMCCPRGDQC